MIQINFTNQTEYDLKDYEKVFEDIASYTINEKFNMKGNIEFSCTFVTKETIQEINRDYRHIDKVTDVISFEDSEGFEEVDGFITLGDIFICIDRAKEQSVDYGHSMYREICFLFTHGMLHLLKMDHIEEDDAKKMFAMQDEIMDHFKIVR